METWIVQGCTLSHPGDGEMRFWPSRYYNVTLSARQSYRDDDHENETRARIMGIVIKCLITRIPECHLGLSLVSRSKEP
jgi:hypothetical protein